MRHRRIPVLLAALLAAAPLMAQEPERPPVIRPTEPEAAPRITAEAGTADLRFLPAAERLGREWANAPAQRESATQGSVVVRRQGEKAPEVPRWRFTVGNTSMNNWSPYPDRALDARVLTFPLPRKADPGARAPQPRPRIPE